MSDDRLDHSLSEQLRREQDAAQHRMFFMAHTYGDVLEGPWGWTPSDGTAMSGGEEQMAALINGSAPWTEVIVIEGPCDD